MKKKKILDMTSLFVKRKALSKAMRLKGTVNYKTGDLTLSYKVQKVIEDEPNNE